MNDTSINEKLTVFDVSFASLTPAEAQQVPIADRLEPYRERIVARHQGGFSWTQIAEVLKQPKIGLKVSATTLRRLFSDKPKRVRRATKRATTIRVLPPDQPNAL